MNENIRALSKCIVAKLNVFLDCLNAFQKGIIYHNEEFGFDIFTPQHCSRPGYFKWVQVFRRYSWNRVTTPVHRPGRSPHGCKCSRVHRHAVFPYPLLEQTLGCTVWWITAFVNPNNEEMTGAFRDFQLLDLGLDMGIGPVKYSSLARYPDCIPLLRELPLNARVFYQISRRQQHLHLR